MNFISLISLFPNIYKKVKIWEYEYDKTWYFGPGNASAKLRFTNHHDLNTQVINQFLICD